MLTYALCNTSQTAKPRGQTLGAANSTCRLVVRTIFSIRLFERSNLHHCLSPPIPNQSSPPVVRFRRLVTIYHMQKFEGKSCIFGVLTKILLNTRNELTSFIPSPSWHRPPLAPHPSLAPSDPRSLSRSSTAGAG